MTGPLRLFIVAGEHSGDALGADLVRRLRATTEVDVFGVGGPDLESTGLASMFPMSDLAVMGWSDTIPRLPLLLWRARQVARAIVKTAPDVVVLVDAQVFSATVARWVRNAGVKVPILLYVSPTVWLWKPERAKKLVGLFDEILAILPFEPKVMADLGGPPTTLVGHPALERMAFRNRVPERGPLLLLPGSRAGELRRHLPVMEAVANGLMDNPRVTKFVIPTVASLEPQLREAIATWQVPAEIVSAGKDKRVAFDTAVAACAVIGTVTFELAASGVPMVAVYQPDPGQQRQVQRYGVRRVALPNIILGRDVVPEVVDGDLDSTPVIAALHGVLVAGDDQLAGFREMRERMAEGTPEFPRADVAARVLAHVKR